MAEVKHYGIPGMRWGKHKVQETARDNARRSERARFQSDLHKIGGTAKDTDKNVYQLAKKHDANMKKIDLEFRKATGKGLPPGPVGERVAKALGMYKDKKGVWQAKPEAYVKAAVIGSALGFASFFVELKVKDFVAKRGVDSVIQSAEYINWLRNG